MENIKKMKKEAKNSDKVYTPEFVAKEIIANFNLYGTVLDPCCGNGAFYDNYPDYVQKDFCELDLGKDFFDYNKHVDWIVSNPPYSCFADWLEHSFEIADNVIYLIPLYLLTTSHRKVELIGAYGLKELLVFHNKNKDWGWNGCGWPMCAAYFKKNYRGETRIHFCTEQLKY